MPPPRAAQSTVLNESSCCTPWLCQCRTYFMLTSRFLIPGSTSAPVSVTKESGSSSQGKQTVLRGGDMALPRWQCHTLPFQCPIFHLFLSEATTSTGVSGTNATGGNTGESECQVYAFCVMKNDNYVLFLHNKKSDLLVALRKINVSICDLAWSQFRQILGVLT